MPSRSRLDGTVVAHAHGPGSSPHFVGVDPSAAIIDARHPRGGRRRRSGRAGRTSTCPGLDLPVEVEAYRAAIAGYRVGGRDDGRRERPLRPAARRHRRDRTRSRSSAAPASTRSACAADGAVVRFPALGPISGDWGGGSGLGEEALWHAARDVDGRGRATALTAAVLDDDAGGVDRRPRRGPALRTARRCPSWPSSRPPCSRRRASGDAIAIELDRPAGGRGRRLRPRVPDPPRIRRPRDPGRARRRAHPRRRPSPHRRDRHRPGRRRPERATDLGVGAADRRGRAARRSRARAPTPAPSSGRAPRSSPRRMTDNQAAASSCCASRTPRRAPDHAVSWSSMVRRCASCCGPASAR